MHDKICPKIIFMPKIYSPVNNSCYTVHTVYKFKLFHSKTTKEVKRKSTLTDWMPTLEMTATRVSSH